MIKRKGNRKLLSTSTISAVFSVELIAFYSLPSGVREWPWLRRKEREAKEKMEKKLRDKDDPSQSNQYKDVRVFSLDQQHNIRIFLDSFI